MSGRTPADYQRILVIKLGALGDFVQALMPMAQIRRAHPKARITLLTTPAFADLAQASGLVDRIDTGGRPKGVLALLGLMVRLRYGGYDRVYDLQTSSRSRNYIYAFTLAVPEWSGISPGASHRHKNPRRDQMQTLDRLWDQIAEAGIVEPLPGGAAPGPDLAFAIEAAGDVAGRFGIDTPYALLAPGASPGRPAKRWPVERFAELAAWLQAQGLTPVVIGGPAEAELGATIAQAAPSTVITTGRTQLVDLAGLGARAALLIGNDTGPTYMAAFAGCPALILFSDDSDPALCAPRVPGVRALHQPDLGDLSVDEVTKAAQQLVGAA
jgi:ADP-heptose:LPS heptosyltransferase